MICLDTNYLIRGVQDGSEESFKLVNWIEQKEELVAAGPAWYEFLCGPVTRDQLATMSAFVSCVIPFSTVEATKAAILFNATNRRRSLRFDSMIAATAITSGAKLATNNHSDFEPFQQHGLLLV